MKMQIGILRQKASEQRITSGTDVDSARSNSLFIHKIKNPILRAFARSYKIGIILSDVAAESKFDSSQGLYFKILDDESQFFMGVSSTPCEADSTAGSPFRVGGRESLHIVPAENVARWRPLGIVEIPKSHQRTCGRGGRYGDG